MPAHNLNQPVVIAGGGPAGSSLAIRLAENGIRVVLVEREVFPRQKLCGEFISPECLTHFERLGVLDQMLSAGGDRISETVYYAVNGASLAIDSKWFGSDALSLSRSTMDATLLDRARKLGVSVYENSTVSRIESDNVRIIGVTIKTDDKNITLEPSLLADATGRARALSKLAARSRDGRPQAKSENARLIGFKAHLRNTRLTKGRCEIYSFPDGYGGLSNIENGLANHCFLVKAELVKKYGDADGIVEGVVSRNPRAHQTLRNAIREGEWLAVSVNSFGTQDPAPLPGLFTVGDSAAFIDPFTGSGMLMAFESSELLAECILHGPDSAARIAQMYRSLYHARFRRRLAVCRVLRRAGFMPKLATGIIRLLSQSETVRNRLARATRPPRIEPS